MRIGINCLKIDPSFAGGLNTYTLGLLDGFAATANGHRFHLYVSHSNRHFFAKYAGRKAFELIVAENQMQAVRVLLCRATLLTRSPKLYELASNAVFSDLRAMMDADCDVIYTPTVVLPCFNSRRPTVLSMHDIQHVHYPEFFSWPRRLSRRVTYGLSAQHARFFQASSEFIKQDLLHHFKSISAEQITVIPEGVNVKEFSTPVDTVSLFKRYGLPARFIFYPGHLWPHKNHITVLRSLKQIEAKNGLRIPLVLTGGKYGAASGIFRYIAGQSMDYVHYLGRVPFADLVGLYQRAALLVVPSLHESNSLPILEAAAAGTPIIASQIPPNEELAGVLQLNLFEPLKIAELADLIVWLWKDEKTVSAQAAHNRLHVGAYSWQSAAHKYFCLFERAMAA